MNLTIFLAALALVESGNDDNAYNRRSGARGCYQITSKVWGQHVGGLPVVFKKAGHSRWWSNVVAERHIEWLKANGVPDQPWDLAYAWHYGLTGYKKHGMKHPSQNMCCCHACRVERIFREAKDEYALRPNLTVLKPAKKARRR